jgi:teichoic acid transport system permease protein
VDIWQRRHFISGFATARNIAMYTEARLGQLWQVLTPLLNAGVYYLIFGLLLGTNRGCRTMFPSWSRASSCSTSPSGRSSPAPR